MIAIVTARARDTSSGGEMWTDPGGIYVEIRRAVIGGKRTANVSLRPWRSGVLSAPCQQRTWPTPPGINQWGRSELQTKNLE
jgi:hypothetical protein